MRRHQVVLRAQRGNARAHGARPTPLQHLVGAGGTPAHRGGVNWANAWASMAHRRPPDYFLSLPLCIEGNAQVVGRWGRGSATARRRPPARPRARRPPADAYREWSDALLASGHPGVERTVLVAPHRLHLTLLMLQLHRCGRARSAASAASDGRQPAPRRPAPRSPERVEQARQLLEMSLQPVVHEVLGHAPLAVRLAGLRSMTQDPSQLHVAYFDVVEASPGGDSLPRLHRLCELLATAFAGAGLAAEAAAPLKLHATALNTKYRRSSGGGGRSGSSRAARQAIDARELLARYGALDLGVARLGSVHLSERARTDAATGYYSSAARISLLTPPDQPQL